MKGGNHVKSPSPGQSFYCMGPLEGEEDKKKKGKVVSVGD